MRSTAALLSAGCLATVATAVVQQRTSVADKIVLGARKQLERPAQYTPGYVKLEYPGGDVPAGTGVCTDVVIRAFRNAGMDLQRLIREDVLAHPRRYPRIAEPDKNIDHRRVPNQAAYFRSHGWMLDGSQRFWPGDIVYWKLPSGLDHIGIVSNRKSAQSQYLVIHNIAQTAEDDVLHRWIIVGHYRVLSKPAHR